MDTLCARHSDTTQLLALLLSWLSCMIQNGAGSCWRRGDSIWQETLVTNNRRTKRPFRARDLVDHSLSRSGRKG